VQLAYRCNNFEKLHSLLIGYLGLSSVVVLLWTDGIENIKCRPKTSTFCGKTKEVTNGMFMQTPKETYLFKNILNARIASSRTGHLFTCAVYPSLIQKLSEIEKTTTSVFPKGIKKIENRGRKIQLVVLCP